ncbi:MAG: cupredoxin domain-containing protein [Candidatus Anstonellaceae archaeon]
MKALLAIMVVAALLFYGCAGSGQQSQPVQNPPSIGGAPQTGGGGQPSGGPSLGQPVPGTNTPDTEAVREITLEASNWEFSPSTIEVNKGEKVRITIINKDVAHGIAIPDFNFTLVANAGQNATGDFVASKEGNYTFFCNVFCGDGHRNMKGMLVVK